MNTIRSIFVAVVVGGMFIATGDIVRTQVVPAPAPLSVVGNELLVEFEPWVTDATKSALRQLVTARAARRINSRGQGHLERVRLTAGTNLTTALRTLRNSAFVRFAEPNWVYRHDASSNDPFYTQGNMWGSYGAGTTPANPFGSHAGEAWVAGVTGSSGVYVAVLDEGIDINHPDLAPNIWTNPFDPVDGIDNDGNGYLDDVHGWDFLEDNNSVYDGGPGNTSIDSHGTHVSGTIGAVGGNSSGVAGVNWDVTIIPAKFLGSNGGSTADAVAAVNYITDLKQRHGLNIVAMNASWGGGGYSQALHDAILRAAKAGILFIAAAGNSGTDNDAAPRYPANYSTLVGTSTEVAAPYEAVTVVTSLTATGARSSFSSYGATTVHLAAPGSAIFSTTPGNTYSSFSGTSMAAAHVTGAAALYQSINPVANAHQTRTALLQTATATPTSSLTGITVTGGRLNVGYWFGSPSAPVPSGNSSGTPAGSVSSGTTLTALDIDTGLVGYWSFDDGSGSTAADSSGQGNTGTLVNSPAWTTGKVNGGLSFNGTNQYVNLGDGTSIRPGAGITNTITLAAWVNLANTSLTRFFIAKDDEQAPQNATYIRYQAGAGIRCLIGNTSLYSSINLSANRWYHVACTYDGSTVRVYIDAVEQGNTPKTGPIADEAGVNWLVGARRPASPMIFMNGKLDDVRIYDRALTAADVSTLFNFTGPDTIPPALSNGSPSGSLPLGTTQTTLSLSTNEDATCRYATQPGTAYAAMINTFATTGGVSHSTPVSGLQDGNTYNYYVRCQDAASNANTADFVISFSVAGDTTAPVLSNGSPSGTLPLGTTQTTLSLSTNENATCRYATQPGTAYAAMINTFATTGGVSHSTPVSGLQNGNTYNYYVRCQDAVSNANTADFLISFSVANGQIPANLIGHWAFDETSGTVASDSSGNNNHGTLINGPVWMAGKVGNSLSFDGTNDYVSLPNAATLIPGTAITLSSWVFLTSTATTAHIIAKDNDLAPNNATYMRYQAGMGIRCLIGGTSLYSSNNLSANRWYHVACTYDGSRMRVYVDALERGSTPKTGAIADEAGVNWLIGARKPAAPSVFMRGRIDDLRMHNRALSGSEIAALAGITPPPPPPPFQTASNWQTFDPGANGVGLTPGGYAGGVFDGRYTYFAPGFWGNSEAMRYDTTLPFDSAASWTAYDPNPASGGGYAGASFDGRYVYFAPWGDNIVSQGEVLRYDTTLPFTSATSWQTFAPVANGVGTHPVGYWGTLFFGGYVYFSPEWDNTRGSHGEVLRYNTALPFNAASSWETFDAGANGVGTDPDGYKGIVSDGRYLFFVPYYNGGSHGEVLRYDTTTSFTSASSWATYTPAANGVGAIAKGFEDAVFDGRYVYFIPSYAGTGPNAYHGEVLRYDTLAPFQSATSWSAFDPGANGVGVDPDGYNGATFFGGRYIIFAPTNNGTAPHGEVLLYDTTLPFNSPSSWLTYDPGANGVGLDPDGYFGTIFDGHYIYFVPDRNKPGGVTHTEVLRYNTGL